MNVLQKYLADADITVADFAESIGRAPSTLWRQVSGERSPSLAVAIDVERGTNGKIKAARFLALCAAARRKAMAPRRTKRAAA
jgi:predicted transcriptional regulator